MSLPTYDEIAQLLDTKVTPPFARPTRVGIKRYLMRVAATRNLTPMSTPRWYRLWKQIEWARGMAKSLRVEIPPGLWAEEQARLGSAITTSYMVGFEEEKERALRWTRRRSPHS